MQTHYKVLLDRAYEVEQAEGLGELVEIVAEASSTSAAWCNELVWGANGLESYTQEVEAAELSRAGNGIKRWGVSSPGLYQVGSTWRSKQAHTTYVLVQQGQAPVLYQDRIEAVYAAQDVGLFTIDLDALWGQVRSLCEARRYRDAVSKLVPYVRDEGQREQLQRYCEQARADEAARMEALFKLPELVGSPKQVTWASSLRAEQVRFVLAAEEALEALEEVWPELHAAFAPGYASVVKAMREELEQEATCRWWIDRSKRLWGEEVGERRRAQHRLPELLAWVKRGQADLTEQDARYIKHAEYDLEHGAESLF